MKELLESRFLEIYGQKPDHCFSCGGRFEVLGNHTDHNHGLCLAATCNLSIYASTKKREDTIINVYSEGFGSFEIDTTILEKQEDEIGTPNALIRGICHYLNNLGYQIGGFNMYANSQIPAGAGVSSSAAFELLIAQIINSLFNENNVPLMTLCKAGQFAERNYYGKMCGLLDQIGVAYGGLVYIDFKDIENPKVEQVSASFDDYQFVIVNSGGSHAGLDHLYAAIPNDMYKVAHYFGKNYLREISFDRFSKEEAKVIEECGQSACERALHFYTENNRVAYAHHVGEGNDPLTIIQMMNKSRESSTKHLRNMCVEDKYENSPLEACDLILEASHNKAGVKINGGGFAGSVIALVPKDVLEDVVNACKERYGKKNVHLVSVRNNMPCELK